MESLPQLICLSRALENCCFVLFRAPSIRPYTYEPKIIILCGRHFSLKIKVVEHGGEASTSSLTWKSSHLAQSLGTYVSVLVSRDWCNKQADLTEMYAFTYSEDRNPKIKVSTGLIPSEACKGESVPYISSSFFLVASDILLLMVDILPVSLYFILL